MVVNNNKRYLFNIIAISAFLQNYLTKGINIKPSSNTIIRRSFIYMVDIQLQELSSSEYP